MTSPNLTLRDATADDYDRFVRFFAELGVEDPVPTRETWVASMAPRTVFLDREGDAVGYAMFDVLAGTGYVRHVVVDPNARRSGVGRALMDAVAARLRAKDCSAWCLNVKQDNTAALALYARVGMSTAYESVAFRFPWALAEMLPPAQRETHALDVAVDQDVLVEQTFALPNGMLAGFRRLPGQVLRGLRDRATGGLVGFARYVPTFPGSFPFRVASPDLASALLASLQEDARSEHDFLMVTVEDDAALARVIEATGARVTMRLMHLRGRLSPES